MYKTLSARLGAFFLTAFCAVCAQAESIVVVDQFPTNGYSDGFVSDTSCQGAGSPPVAVSASFADDFRIQPSPGQTGLAIFAVQFIGRYPPSINPAAPPPFVLRIRDDGDGTGLPGAVREGLAPRYVNMEPLGNGVFQFSIGVEPVTLGPGLYWLEVIENGNATTDCWKWVIGPLDEARGRDGSAWDNDLDGPSGWFPERRPDGKGDNVAMRIAADAVNDPPTPVPLLAREGLMLLGSLLALAAVWKRRKVQR